MSGRPLVVLLHGFLGSAADLAPFARSLGVDARFAFPEGPVELATPARRGRAWWSVDLAARAQSLARGPRDLSAYVPEGLAAARQALERALESLRGEEPDAPLVLGGFSQGAMLACDLALRAEIPLSGLAIFSGARIAADDWAPLYARRRGLRVFASHGRGDPDLSFEAADAFRDDLSRAGCEVTFCPFDGGHEIPLVAWRAFKRWLSAASAR